MAEASFDTTIHEHDGHQRSIVVAVLASAMSTLQQPCGKYYREKE